MEKKAVILLMVGLIGVAMVLAGVVFIATEFFEKQINIKVEQEVPLKEGSDSFNTWKDPPAAATCSSMYLMWWITKTSWLEQGNQKLYRKGHIHKGRFKTRETSHS